MDNNLDFNLKDLSDFSTDEKIDKFDQLYDKVEKYIDYIKSDDFHPDNDWRYYLYEDLISIIASHDFWVWYNNKV